MIAPQGRLSVPKVRAFTDFAVPRLKQQFARLKASIGPRERRESAAASVTPRPAR